MPSCLYSDPVASVLPCGSGISIRHSDRHKMVLAVVAVVVVVAEVVVVVAGG